MSSYRFDEQVALVTGGGAGLGRAYAQELASRGAKVAVNDIAVSEDGRPLAESAAQELREQGFSAVPVGGSVGVESEAITLVERTVEAFGRIDILVNNAGGGGSGKAQETPTERFVDTLTVHLFGMFWTMRAALAHMREQNYGRIINTTSALGVFGAADAVPYVTAKAGIVGLTRAASLDNRDRDIRVNALAPVAATGLSKTYFEARPDLDTRLLAASFVSPALAYLAHRSCDVHGETYAAGGGRVARLFTAAVPGYSSRDLSLEGIVNNLEQVRATTDFRILASSLEQYEMLPRFTD